MAANKRRVTRDAPPSSLTRTSRKQAKLAEMIREDNNVSLNFDKPLLMSQANAIGVINDLTAEPAAGERHLLHCDGVPLEYVVAANESTGTAVRTFPYVSADGLELQLDADRTDGITAFEICPSILSTSLAAKTLGTDDDFFIEATIKIDDISDLGEMFVGFRTAAAFQANPDSYNDVIAFHIGENGSTLADGSINSLVQDDTSGTYSTGLATAWADTVSKTLKIVVGKNRSIDFFVNGTKVKTVGAASSVDSGVVLVPFIHVSSVAGSTAGDPGVSVSSLKFGNH